MTEQSEDAVKSDLTRRKLLAAGAISAVGLTAAACSSKSANPTSVSPGVPGSVVTSAAKVPVGGAEIATAGGKGYVVSQQTAGELECYSAVCPHEGCLVSHIQNNQALCPCHGSRFNVFSGAVEQGPAQTGLTKVSVTVSGGNVVLS